MVVLFFILVLDVNVNRDTPQIGWNGSSSNDYLAQFFPNGTIVWDVSVNRETVSCRAAKFNAGPHIDERVANLII